MYRQELHLDFFHLEDAMTALRASLFFVLVLTAVTAQAQGTARPANFYQGTAPINSRSEAARLAATRTALDQVLVRMTGDVSISLSEAAQPILQSASRYVRNFRYVEVPPSEDQALAGAQAEQQLLVEFEPEALMQAVKNFRLPLWDELRPVTAVWVLGPTEQGARQLWPASRIELQLPALVQAAERRGVPLRFPLMDASDRSAISPLDVVAQDYARIDAASARYNARHILLLRLQPQGRLWSAQWALLRPNEPAQIWESFGDDGNTASRGGFDAFADVLARQYALRIAAGWVQTTRLRVVGLNTLADYARVLRYLEQLGLVESVQPREIINGDLVFLVNFEGGLDDLQRSIAAGGLLREALAPVAVGAVPGVMSGTAESGTAAPAAGASGLSFFAVSAQPELRYQLRP